MANIADKPVPRAVIFDLDGTLYPFTRFYKARFFFHLLSHSPLLLPAAVKARQTLLGADFGTKDALINAFAQKLSALTKGKKSPDFCRRWYLEGYYGAFFKTLRALAGTRKGINETLAKLSGAGVKLAVLSDLGCVRERLDALKIDSSVFDTIKSAEEFGCQKPSTKPFRAILSEWNLKAADVLIIGDRTDTDGAAAAEIGAQFIQAKCSKNADGVDWNEIDKQLNEIATHWAAKC